VSAFDLLRTFGGSAIVAASMSDNAPDFAGMTLSERLCVAGILAEWDAAVTSRDRAALLKMLSKVQAANPHQIADAVLRSSKNPRM